MGLASVIVLAGIGVALCALVGMSLWHNLQGCPGLRAQHAVAEWELTLTELTEEIVERTKRLERVKAGVVRERGLLEARTKRGDGVPDGAGVTEEDLRWLQAQARDAGAD